MWRTLFALSMTGAVVLGRATSAQESRRPYGPFDAIAEGAERSETQRLSLIESQLDTVDQLRLTQVAAPRIRLRDPGVAVYPYGRRGILGLRPRGYVVVRRPPVVVYRPNYAIEAPPYDSEYDSYGYSRQTVRQPIGHELLRTGPNRWEYRPLYADDDRRLDEAHRDIERNLRPLAGDERPAQAGYATQERRAGDPSRASAPEELPEPQDLDDRELTKNGRPSPGRGEARDIAREGADRPIRRASVQQLPDPPRNTRTLPPPQPDPPDQPRKDTSAEKQQPAADDELRGPLLQNPSTGAREF